MNLDKIKYFSLGLLFIFLDINIQGFDILPDFIGGVLLIVACAVLIKESKYFSKAMVSAIIITGLTVIDYISIDINYLYAIMVIVIVSFSYFIYCVFSGFSVLATKLDDMTLSEEIIGKRALLVGITIVSSVLMLFSEVIMIIAGIVGFITYIYMLIIINRFSKRLIDANKLWEQMGTEDMIESVDTEGAQNLIVSEESTDNATSSEEPQVYEGSMGFEDHIEPKE